MLSPRTPRARSAMISPTVRVSASALSGVLPLILVRCSKLASSSLSGTLRMRSSHNRVPERLSIISRAVIGLLPAIKTLVLGTGQSGKRRGLQTSKRECEREALIEPWNRILRKTRTIFCSGYFSAMAPTRDSKILKPSVPPSSCSLARSGCGIMPSTLRPGLQIPAMLFSEPFGFAAAVISPSGLE